MIEIIPSILTDSNETFNSQLRQLETFAKRVQFDFMDGKFVESVSVTPDVARDAKPKIAVEAHLMVADPEEWISNVVRIPVERIIVHLEAVRSTIEKVIGAIKIHGKEVGIALNPGTSLKDVTPYLEDIDMVMFMTIDPGRQGNPFLPEVLPNIRMLRDQNAEIKIEADGGIKRDNIMLLVEAGVDAVSVGSVIWTSEQRPEDVYNELVKMTESFTPPKG